MAMVSLVMLAASVKLSSAGTHVCDHRCCKQVKVIFKQLTPPSLDEHGRYLVGAAVGTRQQDRTRVAELVRVGVDVIILDSSQGTA